MFLPELRLKITRKFLIFMRLGLGTVSDED